MTVHKKTVLVLDCSEPERLAEFYAGLLGAEVRLSKDPDYVEVTHGDGVCLSVHRERDYIPPSWPRPEDSQQAHLRIMVARTDMDEAEREAVGLGARPVDTKDNTGPRDTRTYSDPAGHSFTLAAIPE
ncbi:VOC family protein [Streptomyces sp. NPDC087300]|uniref:VOC family protein n=1 Tax=Streptomyces sp. NPDC087300 TaxID=3365780 RepID=UPI0037F3C212